jgi:uroporphyrinogen III methyltransferase/synthase
MRESVSAAPLTGRTVLVTRALRQAEELAAEIRRHGGTPLLLPTIEIQPPESWDECDRAIGAMEGYHGLIFTSTNGVRFFCERLGQRGVKASVLGSKLICVVGEKTRRAAAGLGLVVTLMPEKFTASDLAHLLAPELLAGKRYLFPRGNLGDDALPVHLHLLGAVVDCVTVYRTEQAHPDNVAAVRKMLLAGDIGVVTFTSPSTFNSFVALFSEDDLLAFRPLTAIAAIGPATAAAINKHGLQVDISPDQSSVESLVEAVIHYYLPGGESRMGGTGAPDG